MINSLLLAAPLSLLLLYALALGWEYFWASQAVRLLQTHARRLKTLQHFDQIDRAAFPPLTLILPVSHLKPHLLDAWIQLDYPEREVLLIYESNQSQDLLAFIERFQLRPMPRFPVSQLPIQRVRGVYQSEKTPTLWLIDKELSSLPDAFNAGLNFCQTPLVAVVSGDTFPEQNALIQAGRAFLENGQIWALGGRIRSSPNWKTGPNPRLAENYWGKIESLFEHQERFLAPLLLSQQQGFGDLSPRFALFRRSSLVEAGGFRGHQLNFVSNTIKELHALARQRTQTMQILFLPDTLAWKAGSQSRADFVKGFKHYHQLQKQLWQMLKPRRSLRRFWLYLVFPILTLLAGLAALMVMLLAPIVGIPLFISLLFAQAALFSRALLLGEYASRRYSRPELQQLLTLVWRFVPWGQFYLSALALQAWFSKTESLPVQRQTQRGKSSPLKQTGRLEDLDGLGLD